MHSGRDCPVPVCTRFDPPVFPPKQSASMDQIFAVVLSYKRKDLLKRCLEGIAAQSRRCDAVIVVDNASNDGTEEMLLESSIDNLKVYVLSHNTGASGGFSAGFLQRYDFGVRSTGDLVPALADQLLVAGNDAADARIRRGGEQAFFRELERAAHHRLVEGGKRLHLRRFFAAFTSCTASRKSSGVSKLRYTEAKRM